MGLILVRTQEKHGMSPQSLFKYAVIFVKNVIDVNGINLVC